MFSLCSSVGLDGPIGFLCHSPPGILEVSLVRSGLLTEKSCTDLFLWKNFWPRGWIFQKKTAVSRQTRQYLPKALHNELGSSLTFKETSSDVPLSFSLTTRATGETGRSASKARLISNIHKGLELWSANSGTNGWFVKHQPGNH